MNHNWSYRTTISETRGKSYWRGAVAASIIWGALFMALMVATSRMADALVRLAQ